MSKLCLCDIDDTCLLFSKGIQAFATERLGKEPLVPIRDQWHLATAYGISESDADALIYEFWDTDAFAHLEPESCAKEVIPRLHAEGWSFVAITAAGTHLGAVRAKNLRKAFGFDWEAVHCVGETGKRHWLQHYSPTIWVEDNFSNAVLGAECGHTAFILTRGYNADDGHPEVTRITDWHDIESFVSNM